MPFDNQVATLRVSGAELKKLLLAHLTSDAHSLISLSGITLSLQCGTHGAALRLFRSSGRAVGDGESLVLRTSDFLALGGDDLFRPLSLGKDRVTVDPKLSFRDALALALKRRARIASADRALFDQARPRLSLPSPRPVHCP
jgi:hypothetical protein